MTRVTDHHATAGTVDRFGMLIERRLGYRVNADDLREALVGRLKATEATSEEAYLAGLETPRSTEEWPALISLLRIPETYFFRNEEHWRAFRQDVIPGLLGRPGGCVSTPRFWSAGCSSGEEPYTIAMMLTEMGLAWALRPGCIIATDIAEEALAAGRTARYRGGSFRATSEERRREFFHPQENAWAINDDISKAVTFDALNLANAQEVSAFIARHGPFQIIFCRNVLIYFTPKVGRQLLSQLADALAPDGTLFLGHSEFPHMWTDLFESIQVADTFVFRKKAPHPSRGGTDERARRGAGLGSPTYRATAAGPSNRRLRTSARRVRPPAPPADRDPARRPAARAPAVRREAEPPARTAESKRMPKRDLWPDIVTVIDDSRHGRDARAVSTARRLVTESEFSPQVRYVLGVALEMSGKTAGAVDAYREATFLDPGFAVAHWRLAQMLGSWKQMDRAVSEAQWALGTIADQSEEHVRRLTDVGKAAMTRMMEQTLEWLVQQKESNVACAVS